MTQVRFDIQAGGFAPANDHCADVRGPGAANGFQPVMRSKFIGKATGKIARLSDIYRIPAPIRREPTEDVNGRNGIERSPDGVVLKLITLAAGPKPNKGT